MSSFVKGLIQAVAYNIKIKVENIHIRYEDASVPSALGIVLKNLIVGPINPESDIVYKADAIEVDK